MKNFLFNLWDLPRKVLDWHKVWIHALKKFPLNFKDEDHRMSKIVTFDSQRNYAETHYFCTCGYLVNEMPENAQEFANLVSKIGKGL